MAIVNFDHLFEQAEKLAAAPPAGPPRQADLRRAMSAAYYGVFHFILTAMADEFVGKTKRTSARYVLVYRRLDHAQLKAICLDIQKLSLPAKLAPFAPDKGFGDNISAFAAVVVDLQEKRHRADYDPAIRFRTSDAMYAIQAARRAVRRFSRASPDRRAMFLTLLLCPPR